MKGFKKITVFILLFAFLLTGCSADSIKSASDGNLSVMRQSESPFVMSDESIQFETAVLTLSNTDQVEFAPMKSKPKKEVTVYITKTGKKYHKVGCKTLKKSKIKTTLSKAKKSKYTPCKVCKPPK